MQTIYKVENKEGKGCYRELGDHAKKILKIISKEASIQKPMRVMDKGIGRDQKYNEICGFISEGQALSWFNKKQLLKLEKYGYNLKSIEVNKITAIGRRQLLAIR